MEISKAPIFLVTFSVLLTLVIVVRKQRSTDQEVITYSIGFDEPENAEGEEIFNFKQKLSQF